VAVDKSGAHRNGKYSRISGAKPRADKATWEDADPDTLWKAITEVTNAGDYIGFGKTRDGGAVVVTVKSEDDSIKEYATGEAEIASLLKLIRDSVADAD